MSTIPSQEATADPELQNSGFKHFDTKCPESGLKCGYWIRYYSERAKEFEAERHILAKRVHDQRLEIVRLEARRPPTPAADQQTELEARKSLPALPETRAIRAGSSFPKVYANAYTADQMQEYARDAIKACFAGGSPARDVEAPAAINQDSARIDWLASKGCVTIEDVIGLDGTEHIEVTDGFDPYGTGATLREAIDAAMLAAGPIEGEGV